MGSRQLCAEIYQKPEGKSLRDTEPKAGIFVQNCETRQISNARRFWWNYCAGFFGGELHNLFWGFPLKLINF
jgi:hypothetical protein